MSRSPFFRDPFWDMFTNSDRFFDSHFGHTLTEDDFFPPGYYRRARVYGMPRRPVMAPVENPLAQAQAQQNLQAQQAPAQQLAPQTPGSPMNPEKYSIMVDVSQFTPEEITVKTIDNTVVVNGKHEDKADNFGYVSRQFSRKYLLPSDVVPETVTSTLSADGILSIQAPRKPLMIKDSEPGRAVPIALSSQCMSPIAQPVACPPQFPTSVPAAAPSAQNIPVTVDSTESQAPTQESPAQ